MMTITTHEVMLPSRKPRSRIDRVRAVLVGNRQKVDGVTVDSFTAGVIVKVHRALSERAGDTTQTSDEQDAWRDRLAKYEAYDVKTMASVAWRLMK